MRVGRLAAEAHHHAVVEDGHDPEHVVQGDAVLEAVGAAGVGRDVAAHRAHLLRRRIRRVVEPVSGHLLREPQVDEPGLDPGEQPLGIDVEHAIHAVERKHDPAPLGRGATGEPGAGAARRHRDAVDMRPAHHRRDLVGGARQHHHVRHGAIERQGVGFIGETRGLAREHAVVADDRAQLVEVGGGELHGRSVARGQAGKGGRAGFYLIERPRLGRPASADRWLAAGTDLVTERPPPGQPAADPPGSGAPDRCLGPASPGRPA